MGTTSPKGLSSSETLGWSIVASQYGHQLKFLAGQSFMIQRPTKTLLRITLIDSWKMGKLILQCVIPRLQHLGLEGEFAREDSWPRTLCLFSYVIFWLSTISDLVWMMMEENLILRLKWRVDCSRKFCLSSQHIPAHSRNRYPVPFSCRIIPRSKKAENLVSGSSLIN